MEGKKIQSYNPNDKRGKGEAVNEGSEGENGREVKVEGGRKEGGCFLSFLNACICVCITRQSYKACTQ